MKFRNRTDEFIATVRQMARLSTNSRMDQQELAKMVAEYHLGVYSELRERHRWPQERVAKVMDDPEIAEYVDAQCRAKKDVSITAMGVVSVEDSLFMC